ncbi:UPF0058 family protein [Methanolacinia petrolearia]|uniref:UPF0058 family protein n=1 Tax=Methanolacinia petrolearia TaxID=54120 RepID=UPI003BAA4B09
MQKEELLHLHMLLVHVKKYYESVRNEDVLTTHYDELNISPVHIHKNKVCHKEAILTLGKELVGYLQNEQIQNVGYAPGTGTEEVAVEY